MRRQPRAHVTYVHDPHDAGGAHTYPDAHTRGENPYNRAMNFPRKFHKYLHSGGYMGKDAVVLLFKLRGERWARLQARNAYLAGRMTAQEYARFCRP